MVVLKNYHLHLVLYLVCGREVDCTESAFRGRQEAAFAKRKLKNVMMDSDSSFVWAVGISIPLELLCDIGLQSGLGPRCTRSIAVSSYLRCGELA